MGFDSMKLSEVLRGLGRVIAYYPGLAKSLGGIKSAVLFCQLFFCSQRAGSEWFPKSQQELCAETGMTLEEQRAARKQLVERGVLHSKYNRLEHRLYFKIDLERLDALWLTQNGHLVNSNVARRETPDGDVGETDFDRFGFETSSESGCREERNGHHATSVPEKKAELEASITPEELVEAWNEFFAPLGLLRVTELSKERRDKARAKISEHPSLDWWNKVLTKIVASPLLKGQRKPAVGYEKSFRADFDWLLEGDNALKTYEGKYDG